MKKNFFKKLALVMALTLTVTSVPATSASAAAAPGFKSKAVKVLVGQTKKYSTANSTKYSVSFKIGNKSVATIATSGKAVKVTGVAAGATTLKATFKNYTTKKVTTAKVPVTVTEEAATVKSVEAKGVKTIVVTFNRAVDTTKAVVAVLKGTAKPSIASTTWAADAKSVTIKMGSKLTEGTYTASVTGLSAAALTGTVSVKDEALTSIEIIGTNLVANANEGANKQIATIGFKTLNQYGERMAATSVKATSSFGTASSDTTVLTSCTATRNGVVQVTNIPTTLSVIGTSGSVVVVDETTGKNASATVTYSAAATPSKVTLKGLYNTAEDKFMDMTKGDDITDYVLAFTAYDQYGNELTAAKTNTKVTTTTSAGVTGLTNTSDTAYSSITVDDVTYVTLALAGSKAAAGTFNVTLVNTSVGLLATGSYTVGTGVYVKAMNISVSDTIYNKQDNELAYEITDGDGNAITKYSVLSSLVNFSVTSGEGSVKWVKKADGTAKLVYNPNATFGTTTTKKTSMIKTFTATANSTTSSSYMVKPVTVSVYEQRFAKQITGIKSTAAIAAATGTSLTIRAKSLVVEDQYSNVIDPTESIFPTESQIYYKVTADTAAGFATTSDNQNFVNDNVNGDYITLAASTAEGSATLSVGLTAKSSTVDYDEEITIYSKDASKATGLYIDSINDGYTAVATGSSLLTVDGTTLDKTDVVVKGKVGGKLIEIPTTYYAISGNTGHALGTVTALNAAQTLTGTMEVTVDLKNGAQTVLSKDYTYSNADAALTTLVNNSTYTLTATTLNAANLAGLFTMKDQYGRTAAAGAFSTGGVKYELVDVTSDSTTRTISFNNTNSATVSFTGTAKFTVTATYGTITASKTVTCN